MRLADEEEQRDRDGIDVDVQQVRDGGRGKMVEGFKI